MNFQLAPQKITETENIKQKQTGKNSNCELDQAKESKQNKW